MHQSDPKYINNQHMHFNVYDVLCSQCFHQHVSTGILAIFRVTLKLQESKRTNLVNCHHHSIIVKIVVSFKIM
jgi:hypothetical protein